jgi:hypothetical protein
VGERNESEENRDEMKWSEERWNCETRKRKEEEKRRRIGTQKK